MGSSAAGTEKVSCFPSHFMSTVGIQSGIVGSTTAMMAVEEGRERERENKDTGSSHMFKG